MVLGIGCVVFVVLLVFVGLTGITLTSESRGSGSDLFTLGAISIGIALVLIVGAYFFSAAFRTIATLRSVTQRGRRFLQRLRGGSRPPRPTALSREPIPAGLRFAVLNRDGFRCAYCGRGKDDGVQLHIDHLVPVALGGKTAIDNLVTACATCNVGKSARDVIGPDVTPASGA